MKLHLCFEHNLFEHNLFERYHQTESWANQEIYDVFCKDLKNIFEDYFNEIEIHSLMNRNHFNAIPHGTYIVSADTLHDDYDLDFHISRIFQNGKTKFIPSSFISGKGRHFVSEMTHRTYMNGIRERNKSLLHSFNNVVIYDYDTYSGKTLNFIKNYLFKNFDISNVKFVTEITAKDNEEILDCRDFFFYKTSYSGFVCVDRECGFVEAPYAHDVAANIAGVNVSRRSYLDEDIFSEQVAIDMKLYKEIKEKILLANDKAKKEWIFRKEDGDCQFF